MIKKWMIVFIAVCFIFFLSGCLPGDGARHEQRPANFITGVWHGWIAPISLVIGLFNKDISIYETANTGWWYDFGYYIAIISGFGSLSLSRSKKKHKSKHNEYDYI